MDRNDPEPGGGGPRTRSQAVVVRSWPVGVFVYDLVIIAALFGVAVWFLDGGATYPNSAFHHLVVRCAWFGALGGVVISLKGIYEHSGARAPNAWDDSYNLWHLGRPVSGAITGVITLILLQALNPSGSVTPSIVYAAAFILGTQERRFFEFLYQVGQIVVQVPRGSDAGGFRITEVQPRQGHGADVVIVRGTGFAPGATVSFGGLPLGSVTVSGDGMAAAGIVPAHAPGAVTVTVTNPSGTSASSEGAFTHLV
jgi:IPT/TIG domain